MLLDQSSLDNVDEIPIEKRVNKHDQDLRTTIPILVYMYKAVLPLMKSQEMTRGAATYTILGGGERCEGMKMQKTAILMHEMTTAVAIFSRCAVALRSEMIEMRLIIICMRN